LINFQTWQPTLRSGERSNASLKIVDLRMYLSFEQVKKAKRTTNQLSGGIITMGNVTPPIKIYYGQTDRPTLKNSSETGSEEISPNEEDDSLRTVR
jgi:hypothetical protein